MQSYELHILRSGVDGWKNGGVDRFYFQTFTLPHIHPRIPQADSVSNRHPVLDVDKHRRPRLHLRPVSIRSTKGAKQSTTA
jgi:hypothetical protein